MSRVPKLNVCVWAGNFDDAMYALGHLTSRYNWMETGFKMALHKLLNCPNQDVAYAVVQQRRSFEALVGLTKQLFEIYNTDLDSRRQLAEIIAKARELNQRRNTYVHSMWYIPGHDHSLVARMKDGASEELTPEQMVTLADEMHQCFTSLRDLMTNSLPIDGREQ
jgi:hypothetical protein